MKVEVGTYISTTKINVKKKNLFFILSSVNTHLIIINKKKNDIIQFDKEKTQFSFDILKFLKILEKEVSKNENFY
jgi:hypothetical protein